MSPNRYSEEFNKVTRRMPKIKFANMESKIAEDIRAQNIPSFKQSITHREDSAGPFSSRGFKANQNDFNKDNSNKTFGTLEPPNVNVFYDPNTMYKGA